MEKKHQVSHNQGPTCPEDASIDLQQAIWPEPELDSSVEPMVQMSARFG